jgi:hypothetical protein
MPRARVAAAATPHIMPVRMSRVVWAPNAEARKPPASAPSGMEPHATRRAALRTRPSSRSGVTRYRWLVITTLNAGAAKDRSPEATPKLRAFGSNARTPTCAAHNQPTVTTTRRAAKLRCTHGATNEPSRPPTPTNANITPISAGEAPSCLARTMSTRVRALKTRFTPPITPTAARRKGWRHTHSRPSAISVFSRADGRARGC